jgi:hypothetical protein
MQIVERFGELSGLKVQPTKSKAIFLNTSIDVSEIHGIPVLQPGETVRYLGYEVGTGPLTDVNWAVRIRNIRRRLATASQLATSVANRVVLLNVVMLPSALFTAAAFEMPKWAEKEMRNLQKQFLWRHTTSTDPSRHKVNPGLLFTPKQAGGVGLASVDIACKTQRAKHTLLWLIQRHDRYYDAWHAWVFRGATHPWATGVSPRGGGSRLVKENHQAPGNTLQILIGRWLEPLASTPEQQQLRAQELRNQEQEAISWTTGGIWRIEIQGELPGAGVERTTAGHSFWPTYYWNDNPEIVDEVGNMLTCNKFDRIASCSLEALHIHREEDGVYALKIPTRGNKPHQQDKLRRWGLAVLSSIPRLDIGATLQVSTAVSMRHLMKLQHAYNWEVIAGDRVRGTRADSTAREAPSLELTQQPNGIHWHVDATAQADSTLQADIEKLRRRENDGDIVVQAHPMLHGFPWEVPDTVANKHVLSALKKLAFRRYRGQHESTKSVVQGLARAANNSTWQTAVMEQMPNTLWAHNNELTEYQVWVSYRIAVRQLNLYHEGRLQDNSCRKGVGCQGTKETLEHIFWDCPSAQTCWLKLISHWTGETWAMPNLSRFQKYCASRTAPPLSTVIKQQLQQRYPDEEEDYWKTWKRTWRILSSICVTSLWIQRNRAVFNEESVSIEESTNEYWTTGIRQLTAIAKRERRSPDKNEQGTRLLQCLTALERLPHEMPPTGASLAQPPGHPNEPALLARLRINQTSSRR